MASLISWGQDPRKRQNNVLNTLSNFDVRTNNAVVNQNRDVRMPSYNNTTPSMQAQRQNVFNRSTGGRQGQVGFSDTVNNTLNSNFSANFNPASLNNSANRNIENARANADRLNQVRDLNRSAIGGFRDNDSDFSYFTNKSFKSVLGDNADTSKMSYRNLIDTYNNASGDQQADIKKAISDEIVTQRDYAKNGEQGSLKVIDYLNDLNSVLDKHGNTKGKSLLRQLGDYVATAGIVGTLGRGVADLANNIGGAIFGQEAGDRARANLEKMDNSRQDLGAIGVMDTALATAANYGANIATGGLWGLANAGIGGANAVANTINDKTLAYDDNGNAIIRHKTDMEKAGELGNAALNAAFAVAGKKGIGPSLTATGKDAATGLAKLSAKDLAKYAAKELPWAAGTTYLQTGLGNLAQGKDWNDMNAGQMTKDFLLNLGQDVGMDAANYGTGRLAQRNAVKTLQEAENRAIANDPNKTRGMSLYERETNVEQPTAYKDGSTILDRARGVADNLYTRAVNHGAVNRLTRALDNTLSGKGNNKDVTFTRMTGDMLNEINTIRKAQGKNILEKRNVTAFAKAIDGHLSSHLENYGSTRAIAQAAFDTLTGADTLVLPGKVERGNKGTLLVKQNNDRFADSVILGNTNDGRTSLKDISPRSSKEIKNRSSERNDLLNNTSVGGSLTLHPIPNKSAAGLPNSARQSALDISTSIVPQNDSVVQNTMPENMKITIETPTERNKKYDTAIKRYYKKYGEDFEEKMPSALQDRYNELLDMAPRDKNGVYTDPITGGRSIDTVVKGGAPDGSNLVKTDYNLPKDATVKDVSRAIHKAIQERFQGNTYRIGDTDMQAAVTKRTKRELEYKNVSKSDFVKKGSMVGNYDELLENMTSIRDVPNRKPEQKPNVDHYVSGRVAVDLGDGEVYFPRVDVEVNKKGKAIGYSISDIKKFPQVDSEVVSIARRPTPSASEGMNGRNTSISQKPSEQERRAALLNRLADKSNIKKPKSETAASVPATGSQKTSKLAENVSNSKNFSAETRQSLKDDPLTYKPTTEVATGTEPLGKAADGTPEFVNRYTSQTTLPDGVDNSKGARKSRFGQFIANLKGSNNAIVQKFYDLAVGNRKKATIATLSTDEAKRYAAEGGVPIAKDAKITLTDNIVRHMDNSGHLTGIRLEPERNSNIQIDANPLTKSDIAKLDGIVKSPDAIKNVEMGLEGQRLKIEKVIDDNMRIIAEVISNGEEIKVIDAYKQNKSSLGEDLPASGTSSMPRNSGTEYSAPATTLPSNISEKTKRSKFTNETIPKSEEVSKKLKHTIKGDNVSYHPTSNAEHLTKTEEFMKSRTLSEAESDIADRVLNKPIGQIDSQDVSDAVAVAKALDAKGDNASLERASTIYESLSKHGTKQGQSIQSLSLLNNRTPEGLRYGAEKAIRKGGTEVTPDIHKKVVANTDMIVKARERLAKAQKLNDATRKNAKQIYDSGNKNITDKAYQNIMADIEMNSRNLDDAKHQLDIAYATLSKTVADNKKMSAGDIYSSIHKAGLLSAPTTHLKNLTSNTTFALSNKITEAPAAAMDALISKITGKRTMAFTTRGILKGGKKGTKYGMEMMKTGIDELNGVGGKYNSGYPELRFKGKIADILIGKYNRGVFRAMGAGDKPFRYSAMANDLYSKGLAEAKNLGIKGKAREVFLAQYVADPPQSALEHAFKMGEQAVLGQNNRIASGINNLVQSAKNSNNLGLKTLGTFLDAHVVPFNKVPTNFLIESSRYTPVGGAVEVFKLADDAIHGRGFDQETFVRSLSKSALGTTALLTLGGMFANNFTGEYPEDEKERNRWEAEGIKENSLKIGDRYVPMEAFGHASLLLGAGAQFWKTIHEGASITDATGVSMTQLARSLEDQSFLTGVQKTMDIMQGKRGSSVENYIKQEVASNVPNLIKKLASATDPYMRNTGKKSGLIEQAVAQVANSIPGLRELLPTKIDAYGNDLKNGAFLSGFLDPTGSGSELQKGNEVIEEVARLHSIAASLGLEDDDRKTMEVTPTDIKYTFGPKGNEVELTDEEQRELTKTTGQLISSTWRDTMNTDEYKNSDDLTRAKLLADGRAAAVSLAKQRFGAEHNYQAPKETNDAKALANDTFKANVSESGDGKNGVTISGNLTSEHKSILEKYNSMSSDDWNTYVYGDSPEAAAAEYKLAKAKYENDVASGKLTDTQKIKRQKELDKLEVSQKWSKDVRDVYSLAGTKANIQELLNGLDDASRERMMGRLNGLNNAMYEAGVISKTTYNTRGRNINNMVSSKSSGRKSSKSGSSSTTEKEAALSSAEAKSLSAAAKELTGDLSAYKVKTPEKPTTSRQMTKAELKSYSNKTYTPKKASISVKKGNK